MLEGERWSELSTTSLAWPIRRGRSASLVLQLRGVGKGVFMLKAISYFKSRISRTGGPAIAAALAVAALTSPANAQDVLDYAGRWTFDDCSTSSNQLANSSFNTTPMTRG